MRKYNYNGRLMSQVEVNQTTDMLDKAFEQGIGSGKLEFLNLLKEQFFCDQCETLIFPKRPEVNEKHFCSNACRQAAYRDRLTSCKPLTPQTHICENPNCGKEFYLLPRKRGPQTRFCSRICQQKTWHKTQKAKQKLDDPMPILYEDL